MKHSKVLMKRHDPVHSQLLKTFTTDFELFLLERMLGKLWDGHVLVLHFPKQLDHHGRELI